MSKFVYAVALISLLSLAGCQGKDKNVDQDGVPFETDTAHLIDKNGQPMTTQEFLMEWCPGENRTPITNQTCLLLKQKQDMEKVMDKYKNNTIKKW